MGILMFSIIIGLILIAAGYTIFLLTVVNKYEKEKPKEKTSKNEEIDFSKMFTPTEKPVYFEPRVKGSIPTSKGRIEIIPKGKSYTSSRRSHQRYSARAERFTDRFIDDPYIREEASLDIISENEDDWDDDNTDGTRRGWTKEDVISHQMKKDKMRRIAEEVFKTTTGNTDYHS